MAEEELWSGWNQVKRELHKISQGDWSKPKRGTERENLEFRQDFINNEAILGRCSYDSDEEGHHLKCQVGRRSMVDKIF